MCKYVYLTWMHGKTMQSCSCEQVQNKHADIILHFTSCMHTTPKQEHVEAHFPPPKKEKKKLNKHIQHVEKKV